MKRIFKRILASLLVATMIIVATPLSGFVGVGSEIWTELSSLSASAEESTLAATGQCGENVIWTFDESTGLLTISGSGVMYDYYSSPFRSNDTIKVVEINDGVTSISESAFESCTNLRIVTIPNSVTSIADYAFACCTDLGFITIGNSVTSIGECAFWDCSILISVTLPDSLESIGARAFYSCESLTSIIIPDSVTSIGDYAFESCTGLTSIIIPDGITSIGDCVFYDTGYYNNEDNWDNNVLYIKNYLIEAKEILSGSYTIKSGTKIISYGAFKNCDILTSITIPDGITSIGGFAFRGCTGLTSITIPNSVTDICDGAFSDCPLEYVKMGDGLTYIPSSLINENYLKTFIIGNGVISIGARTFYNCKSLINITIPNSVTSIGSQAFGYCTRLKSITIPNSVTSINWGAFKNCDILTSITIPDGITSIEAHTFEKCNSLTSITIPNSVISIDYKAFKDCTWLTNITIGNNVKYIHDYAFYNCKDLTSIIIPDSVIGIGEYAFYKCEDLTSVKIGNSVEHIGGRAFRGCTSLESITIPNSVSSIGGYAFDGIDNIIYSDNWYKNIMYGVGSPWGARAVNAYAEGNLYYYDSSKELLVACSAKASGTVTIPDTVEEVDENCFSGCDNIIVSFSSPVNFSDTAFADCNIQDIDAPYNTDSFGVIYTKPVNNTFSTASLSDDDVSIEYDTGILFCNREASGTYTVPSQINKICTNAFANCVDVSVDIPDSVNLKSIGANAFFNSKDFNTDSNWNDNVLIIGNYLIAAKEDILDTFSLPSGIKGIADMAFANCSSLTGFSLDETSSLYFIGNGAFTKCSATLKKNMSLSKAKSLRYIGKSLFDFQSETESETTTEYIDNTLLSVSSDAESFTVETGTTVIADGAFDGCSMLKSIIIPKTVKRIGVDTFKGCTSLTSVIFEGDIDEIGDNAFADCISLTEITIPASVNKIGHLAFYGCTGIQKFNVDSGNTSFKDVDGVLMSADGNTIIQYPAAKAGSEYSIQDNVFVSDLAFYRCCNLNKITLGEEIEYGNRNPFAACTAGFILDGENTDILFGDTDCTILKSVSASVKGKFTVPDTVTEIGSDALRECAGITEIDFSDAEDIDVISDYAFYGCTGLTSITIPNSVTKIGDSAFENCTSLKNVTFLKTTGKINNISLESVGDYAFFNCPCNTEQGSCNYNILKSPDLLIGKNAFNNNGCDSIQIDDSGLIYCQNANESGIKKYVDVDSHIKATCDTTKIGTGSLITVTSVNGCTTSYTAVVFGDTNGDGWYDGMDALTVRLIAAGILTKEDVDEAVYTAADCNHDSKIDNADANLLEQAGILLASVDQTKSEKELLETSSAYVEYINLIDQEIETEDVQTDDTSDETISSNEPSPVNPLEFVISFLMELFSMIKSFFQLLIN